MERKRERIFVVVDTNILFSSLVSKNSAIRDIIFSGSITLYTPDYTLKELEKYWSVIEEKAQKRGIDVVELRIVKLEILSKVIVKPLSFYRDRVMEAYNICKFDRKDTPFIALALKLNIPVWTNDKGIMENQGKYMVVTTEDLLKILRA